MAVINGSKSADFLVGTAGNDSILLRWDDDIAQGNGGADNFIIDGRYVYDGDYYEINDLDFSAGDTLTLRQLDDNTFSDTIDPDNHLQIMGKVNDGAVIDSFDDIVEGVLAGNMSLSFSGLNDTVLTLNIDGNAISILLKGISIFDIGLGGDDLSPGNDVVLGSANNDQMFGWGGDDELLLRWDQDTANGGDGADTFILDGRYVDDGDAHVIEDLNFADGDTLIFRFMDAGTFDDAADPGNDLAVANSGGTATFDSVADILEAHANGVMTAADDGFGGTTLSLTTCGDSFTVTLDGLDII